MGAIVDAIAEQKVKAKIRKLEGYRKDLVDDCGEISAINKNIETLIDDVKSFIGESASYSVEECLRAMKEKDQCSDKHLSNACTAIVNEINYLRRGLDDGGKCK